MENLLSIGRILNFHGIKGEAKIGFSKGKEKQIESLKKVFIKTQEGYKPLNVTSIRFHKQFALIKFKEINSIDELMPLKGENIYLSKEEVSKNLKEEEFLIDELIGLSVFDDKDDYLGKIDSVSDDIGTNILSIKTPQDKVFLVPFVKDLVPIVNLEEKKVIIKPIEGLLDEI